jgi:hypothetical protein
VSLVRQFLIQEDPTNHETDDEINISTDFYRLFCFSLFHLLGEFKVFFLTIFLIHFSRILLFFDYKKKRMKVFSLILSSSRLFV